MADVIQVGKYTLESLTTGMYSDPKIIYREYIQNSVDSLESAVSANLIEPQSMRIDIIVDAESAYVKSGAPLILIATVISMVILPIAFPFFP